MTRPTARAMATSLRTYHRPMKEGEPLLENWEHVVERVVTHQRWLWERALGRTLNDRENHELEECRQLILNRRMAPAGRTLWLGGTELARKRESSMFNCSFTFPKSKPEIVLYVNSPHGFTPPALVVFSNGAKVLKTIK